MIYEFETYRASAGSRKAPIKRFPMYLMLEYSATEFNAIIEQFLDQAAATKIGPARSVAKTLAGAWFVIVPLLGGGAWRRSSYGAGISRLRCLTD